LKNKGIAVTAGRDIAVLLPALRADAHFFIDNI
jgi:hypothetical protein